MLSELVDFTIEVGEKLRPTEAKFDLEKIAFPKQLEFIRNKSRLKALFCTRRASKSYTGGLYMVKEAMENPGVNCLYIGLTRLSAKGILWKDVLKDIDRRYNLGMTFNGTELRATLPNGSVLWLTGADADPQEMEKLLGQKYKLVVIDEAASFTQDLRRMVYGILKPATVDQQGTICLLGTSGNLVSGLFFDITTGVEKGWGLFTWTAYDNPHVAKQWHEEIEEIKRERPDFMETPLFKQWYLNQWVIDEEKLVYRFSFGRNEFQSLPRVHGGEWTYVLGVDLGYDPDPSAFVVVCFHSFLQKLFVLQTFKQTKMDITDVANKIKYYQSMFNCERVVIDGANKQAVEEIQKRHGIALTTADKTGKVDFIQIMNAEFIQRHIVLSEETDDLKEEYQKLIWDEVKLARSGKYEEHPNCANHLTDAALYAWRFCYQFLSEMPKKTPNLRDKQALIEHTQKIMEERLQEEIDREEMKERGEFYDELMALPVETDALSLYINKRKR